MRRKSYIFQYTCRTVNKFHNKFEDLVFMKLAKYVVNFAESRTNVVDVYMRQEFCWPVLTVENYVAQTEFRCPFVVV